MTTRADHSASTGLDPKRNKPLLALLVIIAGICTPSPGLLLAKSLDFGHVVFGENGTEIEAALHFTNLTPVPLSWTIASPHSPFEVVSGDLAFTLQPQEGTSVILKVNGRDQKYPPHESEYEEVIEVESPPVLDPQAGRTYRGESGPLTLYVKAAAYPINFRKERLPKEQEERIIFEEMQKAKQERRRPKLTLESIVMQLRWDSSSSDLKDLDSGEIKEALLFQGLSPDPSNPKVGTPPRPWADCSLSTEPLVGSTWPLSEDVGRGLDSHNKYCEWDYEHMVEGDFVSKQAYFFTSPELIKAKKDSEAKVELLQDNIFRSVFRRNGVWLYSVGSEYGPPKESPINGSVVSQINRATKQLTLYWNPGQDLQSAPTIAGPWSTFPLIKPPVTVNIHDEPGFLFRTVRQ